MSQLAFNYKGKRFVVPPGARRWRVQRMRDGQRGQLDVVRNREGVPLTIPIETEADAFPALVDFRPGQYRLVALDEELMELEDVPAAYVTIPARTTEAVDVDPDDRMRAAAPVAPAASTPQVSAPYGTWPALPMPVAMSGAEYLLGEVIRGQVLTIQTLTSVIGMGTGGAASGASQMITAASELLRAADGAAMPQRVARREPRNAAPVLPAVLPWAPHDDDLELDDLEHEEPPGGDDADGDLLAKVLKVATTVGDALKPVATLVRGHAPQVTTGFRNLAREPPRDDVADEDDDTPFVVTPAMHSHIVLMGHLLGEDARLFRRVLAEMDEDDRRALVTHWCGLDIDDAIADARERLAPIKRHMKRRAQAVERPPDPAAPDDECDATVVPESAAATPPAAGIPPSMQPQLLAVMARLSVAEIGQAQALISTLSESERGAWLAKLSSMSPEEATETVRRELASRSSS